MKQNFIACKTHLSLSFMIGIQSRFDDFGKTLVWLFEIGSIMSSVWLAKGRKGESEIIPIMVDETSYAVSTFRGEDGGGEWGGDESKGGELWIAVEEEEEEEDCFSALLTAAFLVRLVSFFGIVDAPRLDRIWGMVFSRSISRLWLS